MIHIDSLEIIEFRGIRKLALHFNGKSFAICGPNGTGKSGVVDAIEFVLTGNVSRLSGEGSGDVSLKEHGPHVDKRNDPDKARVRATISFPSLNKRATIERSVKTANTLLVSPNDPAVLAVLQQMEVHPEIVLSRRELIRYVLATPGKRAEEIQALLRLNQIEQVRVGLQKIANSCEKQLPPIANAASETRANLLRALNLTEFTAEKVLAVANTPRSILGLPLLVEMTATTSLNDGLAVAKPGQQPRIAKAQAVIDLKAAREELDRVTDGGTKESVSIVLRDLSELAADPAFTLGVKRERFYSLGMELAVAAECPLCDVDWDLDELKRQTQEKLNHLKILTEKRSVAEKKIQPLITLLSNMQSLANVVRG